MCKRSQRSYILNLVDFHGEFVPPTCKKVKTCKIYSLPWQYYTYRKLRPCFQLCSTDKFGIYYEYTLTEGRS